MITAELPAPDVPPNSAAEITVGPFVWEPSQAGHDCMIMVATALGDGSNIDHFERGKSIPEWRLVPHDNNIGLRNVFAVDGNGGNGLHAAFDGLRMAVKNPHDTRARMAVKAILPPLLAERGWQFQFTSPGGGAFSLKARAGRDVVMRLKAGQEFTAKQVRRTRNRSIHVEVFADDILVGGMTYTLDTGAQARSKRKSSRA
jgi:hypothetical protein